MGNLFVFLIYAVLAIGIPVIGYLYGTINEKNHYKSIQEREQKFLNLPAVPTRNTLDKDVRVDGVRLVSGSVVIAADRFKQMLVGLRNIFGGRMSAYETLIDRARREAILRMKEASQGADIIINLRIETASIGQGQDQQQNTVSVEALVYGTAVTLKK